MADIIKTRTYCMVLYPYEDINHYAVMDKLETGGYMYLAIDHDCDTNENGELLKSHTHVYVRLKSPRFRKPFADELGIAENYLEECRNSKAFMQYMVHDGLPDKYQYDHDKVYGSLKHEFNKIFISSDEGSRVLQILELLDSMPRPCSYRKLLIAVCQNGMYSDFRRMGGGIMRLLDDHNMSFDD